MQKIGAFSKTVVFFSLCLSLLLYSVPASADKIKVVATIAPLADFARQVGGNKVEVTLLLPPGASPHIFEPTPKVVREISQARLFLKIGSGLEFWADRMLHSAPTNILIVDSSSGVDLIKGVSHDHDHDHLKHDEQTNPDPHIWLDPLICTQIITKIEAALSRTDPSNALYYKKNAAAYQEKLRELDKEISGRTKLFRTREYVTFHSAWNYFSRRYGLKVAAVIEESPGKEPAPRHVKKIIEILEGLNTRVVFAEPQFSPKIAETIAREAGAKVFFLDPEGGQKGRATYIEMMRYNLAIMEKALR
jgi:zinc transport system substrate-binding protein